MSSSKPEFRLSEDIDRVLREICTAYSIDGSLLSWQFEKHVLLNGQTPFCMNTNHFARQVSLKGGVEKVVVEIEFSEANPNNIKFIRFNEMPSKKHYLVTQTSMQHIHEDSTCALWLELPSGARREDIGAVQALLKVKICCDEWKDFLPVAPETALERAFLVVASQDVEWIKMQLVHKDTAVSRLVNTVACKNVEIAALSNAADKLRGQLDERAASRQEIDDEIAALKKNIEVLRAQLAEKDALLEALEGIESPSPAPKKNPPKKRKVTTPNGRTPRTPRTPNTVPAMTQGGGNGILSSPTMRGGRVLRGRSLAPSPMPLKAPL